MQFQETPAGTPENQASTPHLSSLKCSKCGRPSLTISICGMCLACCVNTPVASHNHEVASPLEAARMSIDIPDRD